MSIDPQAIYRIQPDVDIEKLKRAYLREREAA